MRLLWLITCCTLIIGCATHAPQSTTQKHHRSHSQKPSTPQQRSDGAPKHPKSIVYHAVKPKAEPMSRYGNPDSYKVAGRAYEIMPSAAGYKSKGIASWYGTKFHKQRTSSGEKYDMYAMTAAHRTLPIPSYIQVKNLNNGRVAVVRVNDRGPFHSNRVVDLSYAAAKYLGLLPRGTAPVEVVALGSKNKTSAHVARYYVQAGAFQSSQLASALRNKLHHLTKAAVNIQKVQQRYLVIVGPFPNKQLPMTLKQQLAKQGIGGTFTFLQ